MDEIWLILFTMWLIIDVIFSIIVFKVKEGKINE